MRVKNVKMRPMRESSERVSQVVQNLYVMFLIRHRDALNMSFRISQLSGVFDIMDRSHQECFVLISLFPPAPVTVCI